MREMPVLVLVFLGAFFLSACAGSGLSGPPGQQARLPAPDPAPAPPPDLDPAPTEAQLTGVSAGKIRAGLGQPDFIRKEPGAQIWRYGGEGCTLLVIFYEEKDAALRASLIDARAPGGGKADTQACIASVNKGVQLGIRPT